MATRTVKRVAPWAEVVPGVGPVTVNALLTLPDDGYRYEVVEGTLVRMAGSGYEATTIGLTIAAELRAYARPRRLGVATAAKRKIKQMARRCARRNTWAGSTPARFAMTTRSGSSNAAPKITSMRVTKDR